jgi:mRNA deadenylase 3'-5' endonuclease subunit Ccr4
VFRVATYNILATAYIRARFYAQCDPAHLRARWRVPALVRHCGTLDADLLGLQEVERDVCAALDDALSQQGYAGSYAPKGGGKPDGCATFYRRAVFTLQRAECLAYADGSDHIAQLTLLDYAGRAIGLANTHLKWAPPGETQDLDQIRELLGALSLPAWASADWIICGDFNAKPDSPVLAALQAAGYRPSHSGDTQGYTANPNGAAKTIDYLCHGAGLRSSALPLPRIDDLTPLPSAQHPSDHLAVIADFRPA